jgi:hypothetical protein
MTPEQFALMRRALDWMREHKDHLSPSATVADVMLMLSPLELPPLGEPTPSENRHQRRARKKRERGHAGTA